MFGLWHNRFTMKKRIGRPGDRITDNVAEFRYALHKLQETGELVPLDYLTTASLKVRRITLAQVAIIIITAGLVLALLA